MHETIHDALGEEIERGNQKFLKAIFRPNACENDGGSEIASMILETIQHEHGSILQRLQALEPTMKADATSDPEAQAAYDALLMLIRKNS